jgi:kynurenine formamidase
MRIVDLSRELYHRTPAYPGQPPIDHVHGPLHGLDAERDGRTFPQSLRH